MPDISCKTCRFWAEPEDETWSICILTLDAHETLAETITLVKEEEGEEEAWLEVPDNSEITSALRTREDYGCVQYEHIEL